MIEDKFLKPFVSEEEEEPEEKEAPAEEKESLEE